MKRYIDKRCLTVCHVTSTGGVILPDESLAAAHDAGEHEMESVEIPNFDLELTIFNLAGTRGARIPEAKREELRAIIRKLVS